MSFWSRRAPVNTDEAAITTLLHRGIESVLPKELALKKLRSGERLRVYLGIDPTGARLHLGHSVPLRKLKELSEMGHEVVFLVGSFTAMIGDPTGRDAMREPLSRAAIEKNFSDYKRQASKVLDFSKVSIRYNHEWLEKIDFQKIVELASKFTVQQMLQRDMFEKRLTEGKPVSLHEFLYPLMVGYDSVVLDVDCELGGSDQEFNILAGRHLQSAYGKRDKFVMTTKLLEGTDGRKMSKTYNNAVYLDDTPSEMFGKLMSVRDELVTTYFEVATDVSLQEAVELQSQMHPRDIKIRLAKEVVAMYHGNDAALKAEMEWIKTFSEGGVPEEIKVSVVEKGIKYIDALSGGLQESKGEIRRLAAQGAISTEDGMVIKDIMQEVPHDIILRIGKHRFLKIQVK
jgi:tyrosyl-tRNA synthetase